MFQFTDNLPPKWISAALLKLAVAYDIQRQGHKAQVRPVHRKLERLAKSRAASQMSVQSKRTVTPGGRLVREWHGKTYEVYIADDGVYMEGKRYKSLSSVAREITGTQWNGPRFFGLRSSRTELQTAS